MNWLNQGPNRFAAFANKKRTVSLPTGITMKYVDTGNPKGIPIVLLHGYTDSSRSFQLVIEALQQNRNLRIVAPDLRGHGGSSLPTGALYRQHPEKGYTPALFANDTIALMNHLGIKKAHIAGHSLGSVIAQELSIQYPERIYSQTLINTFVRGTKNPAINEFIVTQILEKTWRPLLEKQKDFRWPQDAWMILPKDLGKPAQQFLETAWVSDPIADDKFVQVIRSETERVPLGTWIGVIKALATLDNMHRLKNLKVPTLILWSTQDNLLLASPDQEWVKSAFRRAAETNGTPVFYKVYGKVPLPASGMQETDLGHNLPWGAPKEVAADLLAFVMSRKPQKGLPFANPRNIKQVVTDHTQSKIEIWGRIASQDERQLRNR
jgi:pimeloyl-ACP methyl ester carboxylesterase